MASSSQDLKEALLQLEKAKKEHPALGGPVAFFQEVLPQLFEPESHDGPAAINLELARGKLSEGVPLLRGELVTVDLAAFWRRWHQIAQAVERHRDAKDGKAIADIVYQNQWEMKQTITAVLDGTPGVIRAKAEAVRLDAELVGTVIRLSLFPSLVNLRAQLTQNAESGIRNPESSGTPHSAFRIRDFLLSWERGYCPFCGSWPLLGEFRGLEQNRYLRCGFCAADWKVPRLLCPFCGSRDHRSLGYLSLEKDDAKYRITTCESCRGYLKMLTTLMPLSPPQLLAADVATMHLDLAAAQRGYGVSW